jgi:membrane protease YdiL (CAAX protease family)
MALLREWRGSVIASMTAHALNNGTLFAVMVVVMR